MMNDLLKNNELIEELSRSSTVKEGALLSDYTTFKTGGRADLFIEPFDETGVTEALSLVRSAGIPLTVIGGGSNLLISDKGLRGAVIKISAEGFNPEIIEGNIYSSSFVSKERFIEFAIESGCGGVEFMAGIPGSIGGGIFMNAGTFLGSFLDIIYRIRIADSSGKVAEMEIDRSSSGYRKMSIPDDSVILGGYFNLPPAEDIDALKSCIKVTVDERWIKHPMEYPSAGSVFKNPEGYSSWKLIDDCGLKGYRIGGAMISEKHTNFIINTGNATSQNIYDLIRYIQFTVYEKTGIHLDTEVRITGSFD